MPSNHHTYVIPYQGHNITYREDGWFNATEAAAKFGKKPHDWLRLPDTDNYLSALCRQLRSEKISLLKVIRGGRNHSDGTWLHPKLAVPFARWLDDDFAVWCDLQIDQIVRGRGDWERSRHVTVAAAKLQSAMLQEVRRAVGKDCANHHYMNEHRMVNAALKGRFEGIDREQLTKQELDLLGHLQVHNSMLLARNLTYQERKVLIHSEAANWRRQHGLPYEGDGDQIAA